MFKIYDVDRNYFSVVVSQEIHQYSSELMSIVDSIWNAEFKKRKGKLFNGKIFSIDRIEKNEIQGHISEYKFFLAQQNNPELFSELNMRPLAVSGILECSDGFVFGKRSPHLTQESNQWELVPSGGIDCHHCTDGQAIDYMAQLFIELKEETGLDQKGIYEYKFVSLIEDASVHVVNIGVHLKSHVDSARLLDIFVQGGNAEYTDIKIVSLLELTNFCNSKKVASVSKELITLFLSES